MKRFILVFALILMVSVIFHKPLLNGISQSLVYEDPLTNAEAVVVLVGSSTGNRIEEGAKVFREGYANKMIFSGYEYYPENSTAYWMKSYAIKLGVPEGKIITENTDLENSTRGECRANLKLLVKNHIKKFVLVTSAFHTRRSKLIYDRAISALGLDIEFLVRPAKDPKVPIQGWWEVRTAKKAIFIEYVKIAAYYFGLFFIN